MVCFRWQYSIQCHHISSTATLFKLHTQTGSLRVQLDRNNDLARPFDAIRWWRRQCCWWRWQSIILNRCPNVGCGHAAAGGGFQGGDALPDRRSYHIRTQADGSCGFRGRRQIVAGSAIVSVRPAVDDLRINHVDEHYSLRMLQQWTTEHFNCNAVKTEPHPTIHPKQIGWTIVVERIPNRKCHHTICKPQDRVTPQAWHNYNMCVWSGCFCVARDEYHTLHVRRNRIDLSHATEHEKHSAQCGTHWTSYHQFHTHTDTTVKAE